MATEIEKGLPKEGKQLTRIYGVTLGLQTAIVEIEKYIENLEQGE